MSLASILLLGVFQDWPIIITAMVCLYCLFKIILPPNTKTVRTLVYWELIEHIAMPVILLLVILFTNSIVTTIIFQSVLIGFIYYFIGIKALDVRKTKEYVKLLVVGISVYFFVMLYPYIVLWLQIYTSLTGWSIMIATNLAFITYYLVHIYVHYSRSNPQVA